MYYQQGEPVFLWWHTSNAHRCTEKKMSTKKPKKVYQSDFPSVTDARDASSLITHERPLLLMCSHLIKHSNQWWVHTFPFSLHTWTKCHKKTPTQRAAAWEVNNRNTDEKQIPSKRNCSQKIIIHLWLQILFWHFTILLSSAIVPVHVSPHLHSQILL